MMAGRVLMATTYAARLRETLPQVRERIEAAARRSERDPAEIRIVTVTKGHGYEAIEAALGAGLLDLGENRVEELEEKAARFAARPIRWHMIGHLQRRKASRVRGIAHLVHSVDSLPLAAKLEGSSGALGVLLQVNTSGEESKSGLAPAELLQTIESILRLPTLRVEGLMTMAPLTDDEGVLRTTFRRLRELQDKARDRLPTYQGRELSMGMSNDYEVAVEEGSTIVRLGTVLLGERPE